MAMACHFLGPFENHISCFAPLIPNRGLSHDCLVPPLSERHTVLAEQAKHALAHLSPDRGQMIRDIRQQFKQLSHGNCPDAAE